MTQSGILFEEDQKFTQRWVQALLWGSLLLVIAIFGYGLVQQLWLRQPWGDRPLSNEALILVSGSIVLFSLLTVTLFYRLRLHVEVGPKGLYVRFHPLRGRLIKFQDIRACSVRQYRPLREYGGWGIRYGRCGRAYNVRGDEGVQLELAQGKRLLIGSQKAPELEAAIRRFWEGPGITARDAYSQ